MSSVPFLQNDNHLSNYPLLYSPIPPWNQALIIYAMFHLCMWCCPWKRRAHWYNANIFSMHTYFYGHLMLLWAAYTTNLVQFILQYLWFYISFFSSPLTLIYFIFKYCSYIYFLTFYKNAQTFHCLYITVYVTLNFQLKLVIVHIKYKWKWLNRTVTVLYCIRLHNMTLQFCI